MADSADASTEESDRPATSRMETDEHPQGLSRQPNGPGGAKATVKTRAGNEPESNNDPKNLKKI